MIVAMIIMFVIACFTLIIVVNMICNAVIESKNSYLDKNIYTIDCQVEENEDKKNKA